MPMAVKVWKRPRVCSTCGHEHWSKDEAKVSLTGKAYCTWCSDTAPPLRIVPRVKHQA